MGKYIEISIRAYIPDDNEELGHDAIVQTRGPVGAIVELLTTLGLQNVDQRRWVGSTKARPSPRAEAVAEGVKSQSVIDALASKMHVQPTEPTRTAAPVDLAKAAE
jgi:hypothetical protein